MDVWPVYELFVIAAETALLYLYAGFHFRRRGGGLRRLILPIAVLLSGGLLVLNNLYLDRISAFFSFLLLDMLFLSAAFQGDLLHILHLKMQFDAINIILEVWTISLIAVFTPYPISQPLTGDALQIAATCISRGLLILVMLLFHRLLTAWNKELSPLQIWRNIACYCVVWLTVTFIYPIDVEAEQYRYLLTLSSAATATGLLLGSAAYFDHKKRQRELEAAEKQQAYDNLERWYASVREELQREREQMGRQEHSLRHHYGYIRSLIDQGEHHRASNYMLGVTRQLPGYQPIRTGNIDINTILGGKEIDMRESGVMLSIDGKLPQIMNFAAIDLCLLLGNLMDNAADACLQPEHAALEKIVKLFFRYTDGALFIEIANPIAQENITPEFFVSRKAEQQKHGYGLSIIDDVIKRYMGFRQSEVKDGKLYISVFLPEQSLVDKT